MQVEALKRDVETGGVTQVSKATIKATPKIFDMFANDTYANKPLAITRELVANAIDAHIAAGKTDVPVEVTLPTALDPVFKVRDEGIGMAHDFVMGPFMAYTDGSTKDKDNSQIGGFGIGSKSPFAYTDQFTLRVVHEGILSVYTMFKAEDGIPAIGLQAQTTTDEPNGVEVSFPVTEADQQTFRDAAQEALQYFQPLPKVLNGEITPPEYNYTGKGWALRPKAGELGIIMGGVRYPVTTGNLDYELQSDAKLKPLLNYGIDITLPIGAAGVAMSREQLSYIPKTSASISAALTGILGEVVETFAHMFDTAKTLWEAKAMLYKETGGQSYGYYNNARAQLLAANAKYKGQLLTDSISFRDLLGKGPLGEAWYIEQHRSVNNVKWKSLHELGTVIPGRVQQVIIDDLPPKERPLARIKYHAGSLMRNNSILILRAPGNNTSKAKIKALRVLLGDPPVQLASKLPLPPKTTYIRGVRPKVRMWLYDGSLARRVRWGDRAPVTNLSPANWKRGIVELDPTEQPTSGIMVVMSHFELPAGFHDKMSTGAVQYDELVFINEGDKAKIAANFKTFDEIYQLRLDAALAKYPDLAARIAVRDNDELKSMMSTITKARQYLTTMTEAQKKRPFGQLLALYDKYVAGISAEEEKLAKVVKPVLPDGIDPAKIIAAFEKQQAEAFTLLNDIGTYNFKWNRPAHLAVLLKLL